MEAILELSKDYIIPFFTCICFLIFILYNRLTSKRIFSYFLCASICIVGVIFSEIFERYYASLTYPTFMRKLLSALGYSFRPMVAFFISLIPLHNKSKKTITLMSIPFILNIILSFISIFTGIVFKFDNQNHFSSGALILVPSITGAIYLITILLFGIIKMKNREYQEAVICSLIAILCLASVMIESNLSLHGILPSACVVGEIFYYMLFLINKYLRDPLTEAFIRSRFYKDIERTGRKYFIIFDINGLKKINDEFGHIVGDKTLTDFSNIVFSLLPPKASFYRIGGDEFAILYRTTKEDDVRNMLKKMHNKSYIMPYGFSSGYAYFTNEKDFNSAYAQADKMLYINKDEYWKNVTKNTTN